MLKFEPVRKKTNILTSDLNSGKSADFKPHKSLYEHVGLHTNLEF